MQQQQVVLNFEYLKPAQYLVDAIVHDPQYIKRKERSKSQRRIWENVPYDAYEKEKMADFMKIIAKNKIQLPADWQDCDTLKMVYCGKFKDKNYLKVVQSHLAWRAVPNNFQPTDINIAFLQKGIVYTFGRDKQQRPILIMNLELVNLKQFSEEVYINALSYYFGIIKKNCFIPGKIENWDFLNSHLKYYSVGKEDYFEWIYKKQNLIAHNKYYKLKNIQEYLSKLIPDFTTQIFIMKQFLLQQLNLSISYFLIKQCEHHLNRSSQYQIKVERAIQLIVGFL